MFCRISDWRKNCYRKEVMCFPRMISWIKRRKKLSRDLLVKQCSVLYLWERSEEQSCRLIFVSGFFERGSWTNRAWNVAFSDELHEKVECVVVVRYNHRETNPLRGLILFFILILYVLWKFTSHITIQFYGSIFPTNI